MKLSVTIVIGRDERPRVDAGALLLPLLGLALAAWSAVRRRPMGSTGSELPPGLLHFGPCGPGCACVGHTPDEQARHVAAAAEWRARHGGW